ncbi:4-hydroxy-tetrahydrodipicolinate synthase [Aquibacillus salsiterrae]|uniref:4-hydroxy-tetrahydrodipicolinate synthase n=1 Tax=Aquibacillus salsiterrae TaxID=2950439 RepID=A0A9X3WDB1_9BACI|nr:4-hydroxy-tetrahydrodipicolinate synthase [Aquibacillus salsiterrae]MDC3416346.1 4-hydroxy-tetrahydrodipicolinate synthase [Aquibacillus salsiterrae]
MMNFGKLLTAMVTPFDRELNIDFEKTTELIEYLIKNGTDGLVVVGTTGESPTLSVDEKLQLFEHVVKTVNKRVPVIAGTGSNNTLASIKLTKEAEKLGVDAALLVTPYYNKPNQAGLYEHFRTIATQTKLPIMLYNIPGRSVVSLDVDTIVRLSKIENIVSVKDSSGDLDSITKIIEQTDPNFSLYSGDDNLTLPIMSVGGDGVVSVSSHVLGNEMKQMITSFNQGDVGKAALLHQQLLPKMKGIFMAPSPAPVKAALRLKGIDTGGVRLPLVELSYEQEEELKNLFQ